MQNDDLFLFTTLVYLVSGWDDLIFHFQYGYVSIGNLAFSYASHCVDGIANYASWIL